MSDATAAAKQRIDRALAALERRVLDIKARAAPVDDDDLFAGVPAAPSRDPEDARRLAELESAGREASLALAEAAEAVRGLLAQEGAD